MNAAGLSLALPLGQPPVQVASQLLQEGLVPPMPVPCSPPHLATSRETREVGTSAAWDLQSVR